MATVVLTTSLREYTGGITEISASGATVSKLLLDLDTRLPGIRAYVVSETGALRRHVNIFVDGELVLDRATLTDALAPKSTVHILHAVSGG